jgi:hypothetical protein
MAPSELLDDLAALIEERIEGEGKKVLMAKEAEEGGYGIVLYSRMVPPAVGRPLVEYIVHRWAFKDTAGNPTRLLYDGGYYTSYEEALHDFDGRRPR